VGKLILVRHGKTALNAHDDAERLRGWMEVPLDSQGLTEAQITSLRIGAHPVEQIFSSDLYRARQTADAVVQATGAPIVHTSDLRPWNVGSLAGQRVQDILPTLLALEEDVTKCAPDGESFLQFYERYARKLGELLELASRSTKCIVAVTHVRNLLATPTILHGGDMTKIPVRGGPPTSSLVWVEKNGKGWKLRLEEGSDPVSVDGAVDESRGAC
jgi:broad specificity phosphatase PhoE